MDSCMLYYYLDESQSQVVQKKNERKIQLKIQTGKAVSKPGWISD